LPELEHRTLRHFAVGFGFPESPRWHDGRLWLSDLAKRQVLAVSPDGDVELIVETEAKPSGLGWLPTGALLLVEMENRRILRADGTHTVIHADLHRLLTADANDMVVGPDGTAYVSNFGYDQSSQEPVATGIVRVRPDGTAKMVGQGLFRPNGLALTHDLKTLIVAETRIGRLTALSLEEDGTVSGSRVVAELGDGGWADGLCLDAEDGIWVADPRLSRCVRVLEGEGVVDIIPTKLPAIACVLGGDDHRTLFITQAPLRGTSWDELAATSPGLVAAVPVDVEGAGWP
jgi:sugar lactone lactonase YvrE